MDTLLIAELDTPAAAKESCCHHERNQDDNEDSLADELTRGRGVVGAKDHDHFYIFEVRRFAFASTWFEGPRSE